MIQEKNFYKADKGKLFVRKIDNFIMGDGIDLGVNDDIDNYEERSFTQEEIDAFYESIGIANDNKNVIYIDETKSLYP